MYQKARAIWKKKQETVDQLNNLKYKYLLTIYEGVVKGKSVKKIHKELYDETMNSGVRSTLMLDNVKKIAKKVINQAKRDDEDGLLFIPIAFRTLNSGKVIDTLNKNIFDYARKEEEKLKNDMIKTDVKKAREKREPVEYVDDNGEVLSFKNVPRIFYLTSKHGDSAEDHEGYQGQIYVDEKWESLIKNKVLKIILQDYITKNCPYTFQWLVGRPVWFITRPNCRHYYTTISVKEALNNSASQLIKKYDMYREIGERGNYQTIRHSTRKSWYTEKNIRAIIKKYEERLEFHRAARKINDNNEVRFLIKKDKLLIEKWRKYLQSIK